MIEESRELSETEKKIILHSTPRIGRYKMAGAFGQYFWNWDLPTGRTVNVRYSGDIKPLLDKENITVVFSD